MLLFSIFNCGRFSNKFRNDASETDNSSKVNYIFLHGKNQEVRVGKLVYMRTLVG